MQNLFRRFTPIIAECNQGQKKEGVRNGGLLLYHKIFHKNKNNPILVDNDNFNNYMGYKKLKKYCFETKYPLVLGGDHSIGSSTVLSSIKKHEKLSVIWIDAHADINTYDASKTKNTHGMPLSMCVGLDKCWWQDNEKLLKYHNLIYVGIRDLDDFEKEVIKNSNIKVFSPERAINFIKKTKNNIHISFDVDGLDPEYMDSTGTIAENGIKPLDVRKIIKTALKKDKLVGLDVVEFNPELGNFEKSMQTMKNIFKI